MLGLILVIIVIWLLSSILQELKSIKSLLIESSIQNQEDIYTSSVEEVWEEATDICPSCGSELDPDSNICPDCGLEFKEN